MSFRIFQNEKTPFQGIKTISPKSQKIDNFPKGLTHGFAPKMAIFPTFFFQAIQARKMSFTIFQKEKTPFQGMKTRSSKSPKIDIYPKGLTHGFGSKMPIFPIFFLANIGQENVFYDILEGKNAFLGYRNKKFKKSKNSHFPKGVNACFWSKNGHFSKFFFKAIYARKMSFTIFQNKKTPFQGTKTRSSKSPKINIFPKGLTYGFGSKMAIFPTFFLRQYRPAKCLLRYSRTRKRLSRV